MARLTITGPAEERRTLDLADARISLGSAATCSVRIDDAQAAPEHCLIERTETGAFKLVDLETPAGTEVNGGKVNFRILENGDLIRIGRIHFQNKKCQALGRLGSNAWQFFELLGQPIDGIRYVGHGLKKSRDLHPGREIPKLTLQRFVHFANAFVDRGDDKILKHVLVASR